MKKQLVLLLLAMFHLTLFAQPVLQWQKNYGGPGGDSALSIKQTSDGGYIVAGTSSSTSGDVTGNHGGTDYWVAKLDAAGTFVWQRSYGGSGYDVAKCVQQTTDGGYVVAGFSNSRNGDVTGRTAGSNHDAWILKLDASGNIVWNKTIYSQISTIDIVEAFANTIIQTTDGGFLMGGFREGNKSINEESGVAYSWNLYTWVVKLNSSGNVLWESKHEAAYDINIAYRGAGGFSYFNTSQDGGYVESLVQTSTGYVVLAHGPFSAVSSTSDCGVKRKNNTYIFKLNFTGGLLWEHYYGTASSDYAVSNVCIGKSIRQTPDGGFIIAGYSNAVSGCLASAGNHGAKDFWLFKINSGGTVLWSTNYGGSNDDMAFDVQISPDGSYYVAGSSYSTGGQVTGHSFTTIPGQDFWIVKTNSSGTFLWGKCYGGTAADRAYACTKTTDGWLVAGFSNSSFGSVVNKGGADWLLTKFTDCTFSPPGIAAPFLFFYCNSPKVSNLSALGTNIRWYTTLTGGTALSPAMPLPLGSYTYYASQQSPGLGCLETARTPANITVNSTCTSLRVANNTNSGINKLTVRPNPNKGSFRLYVPAGSEPEKITVQMISVTGSIVFQEDIITENNAGGHNIDTRHLPAGIYFLKTYSASGSNTIKVQVEK